MRSSQIGLDRREPTLGVSQEIGMVDKDGPDVTKHFYRRMLKDKGKDGHSVEKHKRAAHSLHFAVQKMRRAKYSIDRWANFVHIGA